MISHHMTLYYLTLSLLSKVTKYLSQILTKLAVQGFSSVFRNEYYMVLAFPNRMF